jgi:hypothetical protein
MVFLIQSTQNRDSTAVQVKLDELIRALEPANNKFIGIEKRTIEEVHELRQETAEEVKLMDELIVDVASMHNQLEAAPAIPPHALILLHGNAVLADADLDAGPVLLAIKLIAKDRHGHGEHANDKGDAVAVHIPEPSFV